MTIRDGDRVRVVLTQMMRDRITKLRLLYPDNPPARLHGLVGTVVGGGEDPADAWKQEDQDTQRWVFVEPDERTDEFRYDVPVRIELLEKI